MEIDETQSSPAITAWEDGPYQVNGPVELRDANGGAIPRKGATSLVLCRCGGSGNKPYCDGTHKKIGFRGAKEPNRTPDRRDSYVGAQVTIHDNRGICAHAGVCTDRLTSVWRMKTKPWIDPDGADAQAIIDTIQSCPSGALGYSIGATAQRDEERSPTIQLVKDGPYRVTGAVALEDTVFGEGASREHYTLCRCGGSKNKPFCDGTHWKIDFKDDA